MYVQYYRFADVIVKIDPYILQRELATHVEFAVVLGSTYIHISTLNIYYPPSILLHVALYYAVYCLSTNLLTYLPKVPKNLPIHTSHYLVLRPT